MRNKLTVIALALTLTLCSSCTSEPDPELNLPTIERFNNEHVKDVVASWHLVGYLTDADDLKFITLQSNSALPNSPELSNGDRITNIDLASGNLVLATQNRGILQPMNNELHPIFKPSGPTALFGGGYHFALVSDDSIHLLKRRDTLTIREAFQGDEEITKMTVGPRNIWINTKARGVARIPHTTYSTHVRWLKDDWPNTFNDSILEMKVYGEDQAWMLGTKKLYHYKNHELSILTLPEDITAIDLLTRTKKSPLIASSNTFYELDGIEFIKSSEINSVLPNDIEISCITQDPYGNIWIGTTEGLYMYQKANP